VDETWDWLAGNIYRAVRDSQGSYESRDGIENWSWLEVGERIREIVGHIIPHHYVRRNLRIPPHCVSEESTTRGHGGRSVVKRSGDSSRRGEFKSTPRYNRKALILRAFLL
jgi:hypothetical protein